MFTLSTTQAIAVLLVKVLRVRMKVVQINMAKISSHIFGVAQVNNKLIRLYLRANI